MGSAAGVDIGQRRLLFVGGKGGVGKTTIAAALALSIADAGRRCLLVSTDPAHSLGDLFGRPIGEPAAEITPNLAALEIDPDAQADRYIAGVAHNLRDLVRPELYPDIERSLSLARAAPGAAEAALLDRMTELMDVAGGAYDVVVFDTAPVGHTLRLLSLPELMTAWTDGMLERRDRAEGWGRGLRRLRGRDQPDVDDDRDAGIRRILLDRSRRFQRARARITDADTCGFLLVLIPEPLPILESRKALDGLARAGVPVLGVVVNQVLPRGPLGDFFERRRERETRYRVQIDETFPHIPRWTLPLMPEDVRGVEALRRVAALLTPP
jgi:arsenite/tail-anchored protein-transporting ATPase